MALTGCPLFSIFVFEVINKSYRGVTAYQGRPAGEEEDRTVTSYVTLLELSLPAALHWQSELAMLLQSLYAQADQFIDHAKFGSETWRDIYNEERRTTNSQVFDYIAARDRDTGREGRSTKREGRSTKREGRSSLAGKKGVMYVSLDGGAGAESCPSLADSAAVSLSQMAFLSMTVSIFSVVANIANNLNNNNNNQNDNNLNYVSFLVPRDH